MAQFTLLICLTAACIFLFPPTPGAQNTQSAEEAETKTVEFDGRAMARETIEVLPRSEGPVIEAIERVGRSVNQGEQLFRVDPTRYQFVVDRLQSRFDNLTQRYKNVKEELGKQKGLLDKKLTTSNKVHALMVAYNLIRGNLGEAKAELSAAKFDLENTVIRSPINGLVSEINMDVGDMARREGKPAVIIVKYDPIFIVIDVDPEVHLKIRKRQIKGMKQATNVRLKFTNGEVYPHTGTYVGSFHRVDEKTGKVSHLVTFPNPDLLIIPGLKVKVEGKFEGF
ncbi:MAG: efflux RND transporter periplasmic adaptor subunit [Hyphomicrobiales bacterium]